MRFGLLKTLGIVRLAATFSVAAFASVTAWSSAAPSKALPFLKPKPVFGPPSSRIFQAVPNVFETARGRQLTDRDLDVYIARSVTGSDRVLAHKIMAMMPANERGDFVYSSLSGHLVSNNPALLPYIQLTIRESSRNGASSWSRTARTNTLGRIQPFQVTQCSLPDPPTGGTGAGGAYVRQVSYCGFTTGFGFVNVPCGYTYFANSGDVGYLYFALKGASGSETEGGLQYNNDGSVQPHLVSTIFGDKTTSMNNYGAHYGCGMNLGVFSGATSDGSMTYTQVGVLPSNLTPQYVFIRSSSSALRTPHGSSCNSRAI